MITGVFLDVLAVAVVVMLVSFALEAFVKLFRQLLSAVVAGGLVLLVIGLI